MKNKKLKLLWLKRKLNYFPFDFVKESEKGFNLLNIVSKNSSPCCRRKSSPRNKPYRAIRFTLHRNYCLPFASTLTLHCLAFPAASVAVYVTVIGVPTVTFSGDF